MKKTHLIFLLSILFVAVACEKNKDPEPVPEDLSKTPAYARDSLYKLMKDWYYWYDEMPTITKEDYPDPYLLLEALRHKPQDKWSYVDDYDEFLAADKGAFVGHGFRIGVDNSGKARIALIFKESALYKAGVRRGWIVKKINDVEVAPLLLNDLEGYSTLIGPAEENVSNKFLFEKPDGTEFTLTAVKSSFTLNTVLLYEVLDLKSGKTGHIVFEEFISASEAELAEAFAYFKANNVTNIILDLRYNPGGLVSVARTLGSYIVGNTQSGEIFVKMSYNKKKKAYNSIYPFKTTTLPIGAKKVAFITSGMTASASELVINGIKPFTQQIAIIGDRTYGKPMGMNGWYCGKKYVFLPVTFKTVNSNDEGDYFEGFPADKQAIDDITRDFNDPEEACLKEAISWIENGAFTSKSATLFEKPIQVSDHNAIGNSIFFEGSQD